MTLFFIQDSQKIHQIVVERAIFFLFLQILEKK